MNIRKDDGIKVCLTEEEKGRLREVAIKKGLSLSAYLRMVGLERLNQEEEDEFERIREASKKQGLDLAPFVRMSAIKNSRREKLDKYL